ncbi:MAG: CRISPR-associated endoribonuclease Cas6 [Deinococcota bacterium]|nr:CRISPR-associated endoribonuclease Cas6 [Deinococcota bacterium]
MRLTITLESKGNLVLPVHYNALVQGLVYSLLEPNLAKWLHGEAYRLAARTYKMFVFSRLEGQTTFDRKNSRLTFIGPVSFKLASYNTDILSSLAEHLLKSSQLRLGNNACAVSGIEILTPPKPDFGRPVRVKALSPITIYSTLTHGDGRKKTYYYDPREREWGGMILGNLARKAKALGWEEAPDEALKEAWVRPYRVNEGDQKIIIYKGSMFKAWTGVYEMTLPQPYFELAYDVGLGGKNAQGFGMVEVVR